MAVMIDGKALATQMRQEIAKRVGKLKEKGITPGLAVVLVGEDPASQVYVRMKQKACKEVGITSEEHRYPSEVSQKELKALINRLNVDPKIHGILVQLPLPEHIDEEAILEAISVAKDVDGFHPYNAGLLSIGRSKFVPCTPAGIMALIHSTGVQISGKKAVVVGRSNIVGKPTAALLLAENATVTIAHSRTQDLAAVCREADILVAAVGRPRLIKQEMVKPGAIVIDVGINRCGDGCLVGDVDYEAVSEVAGYITPVPGGVGPMTITMLLESTLRSAAGE